MATLRRAEEVGVNAWQNTLTERSAADLQRYRDEGGAIHYFCLSRGGYWYDDPSLIDEAAKHNPIGMAPHGSGVAGAMFFRKIAWTIFEIFSSASAIQGLWSGCRYTIPASLRLPKKKTGISDYYMTALYYLQGAREEFEQKFGHQPLSEIYLREHRDRMCGIIRSTDKPCIAFKVLAAGRTINSKNQIREEFAFTLKNIKPNDVLLVGMYQKFNDQLGENAAMIAELCQG